VLVGDHPAARRGLHHLDQVLVEKVAEQHADHAKREPDERGDLGSIVFTVVV
jgi:hypothetical protein